MNFASPRERVVATAAYYASMLTLGFGTAIVGPTLAGLAARTHASIGAIGVVFTASALGYLVGSLLSGHWFDRLPGHRVLGIALSLVAASFAIVPFTASLWPLVATFFLLGAASATIDVGTNTLLLWIYRDPPGGNTRVGGVMNGLHFCFGAGALVAPAVVAWSIRATHDIAMAYWSLGIVTSTIAAALFLIPSAPEPIRAGTHDATPPRPRLIALIAAVFAFYVAAEVAYGGWISIYGIELGFGDAAQTAYLASVFWGMLTLGRLIGVPLASRVRATTIIAIDHAGALVCLFAILCVPASAVVLWIATGLFGFFLASIFPMLLVFSGERMPVSGRSTSWYLATSGLGGMTLPWLIGQSFVAFGPSSLLWMDALAVSLGAAAFALAALQPRATTPR
ncbi:MAG TPA: MFS transporter [Pseudomonadales bacterium]|nr:MFS transporter [Pseudomonadales bacterium]